MVAKGRRANMETTIKTHRGTITVTDNGHICFHPNFSFEGMSCLAREQGMPGVIGPDIDINLFDVIKKIQQEAIDDSFTNSPYNGPIV